MKSGIALWCVLAWATPLFAADWVSVTSPTHGFRAEFPVQPEESVQTIETALGRIPYATYLAETAGRSVAYGLAVNDYPDEVQLADPETVLDDGRDGAKANLKGTVVSETRMQYHGHPAREFTIVADIQGQKLFCHTRLFLIGSRLYQLQVVRVGETPLDIADVVRFFAAFEEIAR